MSTGPSLFFLIKSFLKVGLTSFGGHAALVSVLQEEMVKKKVLTEEVILDGLSIASFLPGPLAVNVVAYIGYKLRKWPGAIISIVFVLLPSTVMMIGLAKLYEVYSDLDGVNRFLSGVIPVVIALILSLCYQMFIKHMATGWQYLLFALILFAAFFLHSYFWIIIFIVLGGISGNFLRKADAEERNISKRVNHPDRLHLYVGISFFAITFIILNFLLKGINHQLLIEFSKVSLTLFGGGYVMIPMLHSIVVDNFHWLSSTEFANAIAFGQVTPGPILVSATYIGYISGGLFGAFIATFGIFAPSAILMVLLSAEFENIKDHPVTKGILKGIRPVIIALITYSGWILFESLDHKIVSALMAVSSFIIITYTKFNYFFLILLSGVVALLFF